MTVPANDLPMTRIDGTVFARRLRAGYNALKRQEKYINATNVFPVADGDTGTNMCQTLGHALESTPEDSHIGHYLSCLSHGMLMSARGNSGVILSQLFRGLSGSLEHYRVADAQQTLDALICAYQTAYQSVAKPAEGTILTVAREGTEIFSARLASDTPVRDMMLGYVEAARRSLARTPELLEPLKQAGVVDSGALGYITILEGMLGLTSDTDESDPAWDADAFAAPEPGAPCDTSNFTADSAFELGYCTEALLQSLNRPPYLPLPPTDELAEKLSALGDSLVVVTDDSRLKVHIHTKRPEKVIECLRRYGEFVTFKLENMQIQHNNRLASEKKPAAVSARMPAPQSPLADKVALDVVTVCNGNGQADIFTQAGCRLVVDGGPLFNPSVEDIFAAYCRANAGRIAVFPNNPNVLSTAQAALDLYNRTCPSPVPVTVIDSVSPVCALLAMAWDTPDDPDVDRRLRSLTRHAGDVTVLELAPASKKYTAADGSSGDVGDVLALVNSEVMTGTGSVRDSLRAVLSQMEDRDGKETVILLFGSDMPRDFKDECEEIVNDFFPDAEVSVYEGGQPVRWLIAGIV